MFKKYNNLFFFTSTALIYSPVSSQWKDHNYLLRSQMELKHNLHTWFHLTLLVVSLYVCIISPTWQKRKLILKGKLRKPLHCQYGLEAWFKYYRRLCPYLYAILKFLLRLQTFLMPDGYLPCPDFTALWSSSDTADYSHFLGLCHTIFLVAPFQPLSSLPFSPSTCPQNISDLQNKLMALAMTNMLSLKFLPPVKPYSWFLRRNA